MYQGVIQCHVFFLCAFLYLSYVKLYKVEVKTSFKPNTFGHKYLNAFIFAVIFLSLFSEKKLEEIL